MRLPGTGLLTKYQYKQWKTLASRFRITQAEFLEYYNEIRKANRKIKRLNAQGIVIDQWTYSTRIDRITSRAEFTKRRKRAKDILQRDFRKRHNISERTNFYANLSAIFGSEANVLIDIFGTMPDVMFIKFFEENSEIHGLVWDSIKSATELASTINLTYESMINRLKAFNENNKG